MSASTPSSRSPARRAPAPRRSSSTFEQIFRREGIKAVSIEGDAFHRYDRAAMKRELDGGGGRPGNDHFQPFRPATPTSSTELEKVFRDYGETGTGRTRHYVHDDGEAELYGAAPGHLHRLGDAPSRHRPPVLRGPARRRRHRRGQRRRSIADLKIGVVPVINLEWIQKIHRDRATRGYSTEAVTDTILRRMPDYVHYICPQFTETDINFQRVPAVDTSNPFIARWIPTAGRMHGRDPLPQPARHRLPLSASR